MNILVCIPCLLTGGTEVQTLSLVRALIASGHNVSVVCYFEHTPEMVTRFRKEGAAVRLLSPEGTRPAGIITTTSLLWKGLSKIIRTEKPDAAHVQYMAPGALPILILRALGIKKILATSHTDADIYSKNGLRIIRFLTRYVLSGFQCITQRAEKSYFGSSHLFDGTPAQHFTIHNSLPDHISIRTQPRAAYKPGDPLTIGVVSRLEKIKGMDLVIPAFAQVSCNHPDVRLLIVGDGSLRDEMKTQAEQARISERVEFMGQIPQEELRAQYDRINILLMPSRSEGFGLTALEGMARGCVPIVANTGGLPEVVADGIDGLLHTPQSVDDIAQKIKSILSDPVLFEKLSSAAISKAQNFSFNNYQKHIYALYNKCSDR